jgi:hypothetical protein
VIFQILRSLKGGHGQKAKQHRVDEPVIRRDEDQEVIDLPLSMDHLAQMRMNNCNAKKGDDKEKTTKD